MLSFSNVRRAMRPALAMATVATLSFASLSLSMTRAADARPFLSPLFTDNMVLQRGIADPIWGWTAAGQTVTVTVGGKSVRAVAGADGKWTAKIGPLPVGGPYTVTVGGPQTVTLTNVLVGDVWLCSGQSNMEFGIGNVVNSDAEIAAANYPTVRLLMLDDKTAATPQDTFTGGPWAVCTPENVRKGGWNGFSAVGYFFARDLSQNQHIPIGLIESDWGGTPAQAWTSAEALNTLPDFRTQMAIQRDPSRYPAALEAWYVMYDAGSADKTWADPAFDASTWKTMALPTAWEQAGVPALAKFDGVVWFRKEITLPAGWAGKAATLHLGPVDDRDTTYVNGVKVGGLDQYDAPRDYKLAASLLKPGRNVIAVRVLDSGGGGGLDGKPEQMSLEASGETPLPLSGDWSYQIGGPLPTADPAPTAPNGNQNDPTMLYNAMIAPLIPSGLKGALWYQGEANAGNAGQYRTLLPTLIGDWRTRFGQGNFPFLIVQLAGWSPGDDAWPDLRQAQWLTAQTVPGAGIAAAIDVGDSADIHPKNKQEVGRRLALVAEAQVYGQAVEDSGPVYKSRKIEDNAVRLSFTHLGGGLAAKDGRPLTAFAVAGADGKFVPADARIDGDTVVVSSPLVPSPTAVRYAWSGFPENSLYNKAGLPAFPFDTGAK